MQTEHICHEVKVASISTSEGRQAETKEEKEFQYKVNAFLKKLDKTTGSKKKYPVLYQAIPINKGDKTIVVKYSALIIY